MQSIGVVVLLGIFIIGISSCSNDDSKTSVENTIGSDYFIFDGKE